MLLTEEMAADVCDGMGMGALLDAPWIQLGAPHIDPETGMHSFRVTCGCDKFGPKGPVTVTVRALASIKLTMEQTVGTYYLYVGQCQRCRRVYWTSSRNHPMLGEEIG